MVKKVTALTTALTILATSSAITFADTNNIGLNVSQMGENGYIPLGYDIQSNKFKNEVVETDYKYHLTTTITEDDIAYALQVASTEVNILGYFAAGIAVKPIAGAVQVGKEVSKAKLLEIVRRQLGVMAGIEIVERTTSAGLTWWEFKAEQRVSEVKYTYRYQVNMLTNQRTLTSTTATYRINVYRRESATSPWRFITTETKSSTY